MSRANLEKVRASIDAANRRDFDAVLEHAAPNFEWDNSRAMNDEHEVYTRDEVRGFWARGLEMWESMRIEIDELIDSGDHVVVPHTTYFRGRDGIEVTARTTWLVTFHEGRIERICLYQDKQEALEEIGLRA